MECKNDNGLLNMKNWKLLLFNPLTFLIFFVVAYLGVKHFSEAGKVVKKGDTPMRQLNSGYIGSPEKWSEYYQCIARKPSLSALAGESMKIAQKNADGQRLSLQLHQIEKAKNIRFPKSYQDFVVSGGIFFMNDLLRAVMKDKSGPMFFTVGAIGRFKDLNKQDYDAFYRAKEEFPDREYYWYDAYDGNGKADSANIRSYDINFVQIGAWDTDSYGFLDSEVTRDGEFEAWSFSPDNPGAYRYRSFAEFLIFDRMRFLLGMVGKENPESLIKDECTGLLLDMSVLRSNTRPVL